MKLTFIKVLDDFSFILMVCEAHFRADCFVKLVLCNKGLKEAEAVIERLLYWPNSKPTTQEQIIAIDTSGFHGLKSMI